MVLLLVRFGPELSGRVRSWTGEIRDLEGAQEVEGAGERVLLSVRPLQRTPQAPLPSRNWSALTRIASTLASGVQALSLTAFQQTFQFLVGSGQQLGEPLGELTAGVDAGLGVDVGQVERDRTAGDEQLQAELLNSSGQPQRAGNG